jgi:hypothetical protein
MSLKAPPILQTYALFGPHDIFTVTNYLKLRENLEISELNTENAGQLRIIGLC